MIIDISKDAEELGFKASQFAAVNITQASGSIF